MATRRKTIKQTIGAAVLGNLASAAAKNALKSDKKAKSALTRAVQPLLKTGLGLKRQPKMADVDVGGVTLSDNLVTVSVAVRVGEESIAVTLKLTAE